MAPLTRNLVRGPASRLPIASLGFRFLKYMIFLLFLVNFRSWPLVWHIRVFRPVVVLRFQYILLHLRLTLKPRHVKQKALVKWNESLSPIGKNPLDYEVSYSTWASPDDCDFNMHLSNSCYAGKLDAARLKHALKCFPTFFRAGGWMPLGGTHYNFVREIPILSRYEIRLSVASWDNKWMYIVARFVSRPSISSKSKSKSKRQTHRPPSSLSSTSSTISLSHLPTPPADGTPCPIIHVSEAPLTPPTPTSPTYPKTLGSPFALTSLSDESKAGTKEEAQAQALAAALRAHEEPDGATLHCVAVSTVCFKMGRITVPPALVIASDGFSVGPEASAKANAEGNGYANGDAKAPVLKPYSHSNPPPHWKHVLQLRGSDWTLNNTKSPSGPLRTLRDFFVGGWRNIPEGARWWEDALSGAVERQRARGMEVVIELRRAMDGLRML